jgi:hypothetical protein
MVETCVIEGNARRVDFGMNPQPVMIFDVCDLSGDNGDLLKRADCITTGSYREEMRGDKRLFRGRGDGENTFTSWYIFVYYMLYERVWRRTSERRDSIGEANHIRKEECSLSSFRTEVLVRERVPLNLSLERPHKSVGLNRGSNGCPRSRI